MRWQLVYLCCVFATVVTYYPGTVNGVPGGAKEVTGAENNLELEELGRFAVEQHNAKEDTATSLSFVRVVSAKQQIVQGKLYTITIEAVSEGQSGHYEARVWLKPWEKHRSLEGFKFLGPSLTSADLGTKPGQCSNPDAEDFD